jgi:hypothetical protein
MSIPQLTSVVSQANASGSAARTRAKFFMAATIGRASDELRPDDEKADAWGRAGSFMK